MTSILTLRSSLAFLLELSIWHLPKSLRDTELMTLSRLFKFMAYVASLAALMSACLAINMVLLQLRKTHFNNSEFNY